VRVDWEACFHCGARAPVTRPMARRILDAAALFIVVGTLTTMAVRIGSASSAPSAAPERLLADIARSAGAMLAAGPTRAEDPRAAVAHDWGLAALTPLTRAGAAGLSAGVPLATLAVEDSAARVFDEARIDRAIAAAASGPALDSLEARLHEDYPRDRRLRPDGRTGRRLAARRAQLARS
jgi:hypothetical protein